MPLLSPSARSSGLLLHISSLPSLGGIGDMGPAAFSFADFLAHAKQRLWQVLPLNPVGYGNSPYGSLSAFAGNPLLISLERLADWNWIPFERLGSLSGHTGNVDFEDVKQRKLPLLAEGAAHFLREHSAEHWRHYERFCHDNSYWLEDYALFTVLRRKYQSAAWTTWPKAIARRDPAALDQVRREHAHDLAIERVIQFAFDAQWGDLRQYCAERDIRFVGDVAIFVSFDSADVWTHPDIFELQDGEQDGFAPVRVSGVPPDYFSKTGQRWGNPLYKWEVLAERKFDWWVERIRRAQALYDIIRLDHFRGFEAYWAIPAKDETAVNGEWVKAPGAELFSRLREALGELPFVAEDLGLITPEVDLLRMHFRLPGMRVLQFGFNDRGAHNYLPHRYEPNTVVYTGTHDNDTTAGWWRHGANENEIRAVRTYIGPLPDEEVVWALIRLAATSVADVCIFPVQDVLGLGSESRMNTPSEPANNWSWRCPPGLLTVDVADRLAVLTEVTDRDGVPPPS